MKAQRRVVRTIPQHQVCVKCGRNATRSPYRNICVRCAGLVRRQETTGMERRTPSAEEAPGVESGA